MPTFFILLPFHAASSLLCDMVVNLNEDFSTPRYIILAMICFGFDLIANQIVARDLHDLLVA